MESKAHDFIRLKIDNKFEICQLCGTRREYKEPLSKIKVIGNDESVEIVTDKISIISKTRWGSDDPVKKVVDHSDTYIDSPPLRYRGDTVYTSDYVDGLKKEIEELKEQLEIKETINQDLVKKYQLLEEEIQAYDINMLELVESYKKLEQDYNDSTERLKIKGEVLSNLTAHTNELEDKYKELEQEVNRLNSILRKENDKLDNFKDSGLKRIEINIFPRG